MTLDDLTRTNSASGSTSLTRVGGYNLHEGGIPITWKLDFPRFREAADQNLWPAAQAIINQLSAEYGRIPDNYRENMPLEGNFASLNTGESPIEIGPGFVYTWDASKTELPLLKGLKEKLQVTIFQHPDSKRHFLYQVTVGVGPSESVFALGNYDAQDSKVQGETKLLGE